MSGGSYDYLCLRVHALEDQRGMLENMAMRLEGLPYAAEAAVQTRRVLRLVDTSTGLADSLTDVWRAVEWWDSNDSSEAGAIEECRKYQAPALETSEGDAQAPDPGLLYRLVDVGGGAYELRPVSHV